MKIPDNCQVKFLQEYGELYGMFINKTSLIYDKDCGTWWVSNDNYNLSAKCYLEEIPDGAALIDGSFLCRQLPNHDFDDTEFYLYFKGKLVGFYNSCGELNINEFSTDAYTSACQWYIVKLIEWDFNNLSFVGTDIDKIVDDICEQEDECDLPIFEKVKFTDSYMYESIHGGYFYRPFCNSEININYDMYRNILGWVSE